MAVPSAALSSPICKLRPRGRLGASSLRALPSSPGQACGPGLPGENFRRQPQRPQPASSAAPGAGSLPAPGSLPSPSCPATLLLPQLQGSSFLGSLSTPSLLCGPPLSCPDALCALLLSAACRVAPFLIPGSFHPCTSCLPTRLRFLVARGLVLGSPVQCRAERAGSSHRKGGPRAPTPRPCKHTVCTADLSQQAIGQKSSFFPCKILYPHFNVLVVNYVLTVKALSTRAADYDAQGQTD